ncbi:hypothetical protein CP532_3916 [Ophiocordyceps camponoti-leonardi (nom. inval.)]|nr:hypothetical protein CP532_3916 [Ophiocordyceps camponoti-leonardi (nom. inval.)]
MFCAAVARSASWAVPRAMNRCGPQRLSSTLSPANRSRTVRGSLARWALALGAVYYYNTSPVFADEVEGTATVSPLATSRSYEGADLEDIAEPTIPAPSPFPSPEPNTVDAVVEQKRKQARAAVLSDRQQQSSATEAKAEAVGETTAPGSIPAEGDEDDGGQGGAFNPETGEINWDCPCLGGMAHGPCGEQFRAAFSCFVYSNEEPKGMDCIEKFQSMQDCFREHPDVYGAELEDDELPEEDATEVPATEKSATPKRDEPSRDGRETSIREAAAGQGTTRGSDKSSAEDKAPRVIEDDGKRQKTAAEKDAARKVDADAKPHRHEVTAESNTDAPWRDASVTNGADARKGS